MSEGLSKQDLARQGGSAALMSDYVKAFPAKWSRLYLVNVTCGQRCKRKRDLRCYIYGKVRSDSG